MWFIMPLEHEQRRVKEHFCNDTVGQPDLLNCLPNVKKIEFTFYICKEKKEHSNKINLQDSQMSQSCKIPLGDFSEIVCIQIPRWKIRKKES